MADYITIKYKINKNEQIINLFGSGFIWKNIDKCKIIHKGKEYKFEMYSYDTID